MKQRTPRPIGEPGPPLRAAQFRFGLLAAAGALLTFAAFLAAAHSPPSWPCSVRPCSSPSASTGPCRRSPGGACGEPTRR
ncbi:hypothetical protein ACFQX7_15695 [Luedemannella flava]